MTKTELMQIITGFFGTVGFSILFNVKGKRLVMASIGGLMSWTMFVLLGHLIESEPMRYFIVASSVSVYAEVMARKLKTPTTTMLMTSLIPLIPGGSLYYTMAYALEADATKFINKGIYTLQLATSLALGIVIMTTITRVANKMIHRNR